MLTRVFLLAVLSWYGPALFATTDVATAIRTHLGRQITEGIPSSVILKQDRSVVSVSCSSNSGANEKCLHDLMVGRSQEFYLKIQPADGDKISTDRIARLLVFDGESKVIPFALMQWRWPRDILHVANTKDGDGISVCFQDVFLPSLLPIGAQLIVLHGDPHGDTFYYQTLPMTTVRHARQGLSAPISRTIIDYSPPRIQWTLPLETKVTKGAKIRWYLQAISDDGNFRVETDAGEFTITESSSSLSIMNKATQGHLGCQELIVFIDPDEVWLESTVIVASDYCQQ